MSYQVIARKYRPQKFADVVGQEHVTQTLSNAIAAGRIAHAYLFVGPRGTGKTTIARIFAKCLNCTGGPKVDFPENDPRAQEITEGRSLDVLEIDGASNNGVEQVRELRETCKYAPASAKFKIYIIDEVHMLSTAAFNALLKTLEEPPAHVKFMFATTEPEKVLPTILSRCQRFDLRRIPAALIVEHLAHIAKLENVKIDEAALHAIARGADGGMRDAESTLDQLISFCGGEIMEADVLSMFGLAAQSQILALAQAIISGEIETTLRQLNELAKNGKDLGRLLSDLLNYFRNLLIYQVSRGDRKVLEVSEAEAAALKEHSSALSAETLTRIMELLTEGERRLREAASKKILIEVTLLKAIQARQAVSIDAVLKQLQELRSENIANFSAPKHTTENIPVHRTIAPTTIAASISQNVTADAPVSEIPSADLETLWRQLLDSVGRASAFMRSYLLEAHPVSFAKNILTIGFDSEFADHISLVDNARNHTLLQTKLQELGHPDSQIKFIKSEGNRAGLSIEPPLTPPTGSPTLTKSEAPKTAETIRPAAKSSSESDQSNKENFKNDPLIQKALEIFKGQIVEVRS